MKKWIILSCLVVVLIIVGLSVYAYQVVRGPLVHQYEQVERYIYGQGLLETINEISYYHGTEAYYVVEGLDEEEKNLFIWVSDAFNNVYEAEAADGISEEEAIAIVNNEEEIKEIVSIRLGYERKRPVYEVTFTHENNRKGYYYLDFKDGSIIKHYTLRVE